METAQTIAEKRFVITGTVPITVGDERSCEEVVRAGKYRWVSPYITSANFPMRITTRGRVLLAIVELRRDTQLVAPGEVIEAAQRLGAKRPAYEHALYFGEQCPDKFRSREFVFFHEPVLGSIVTPRHDAAMRRLDLDPFDRERGCFASFAFVLSEF